MLSQNVSMIPSASENQNRIKILSTYGIYLLLRLNDENFNGQCVKFECTNDLHLAIQTLPGR